MGALKNKWKSKIDPAFDKAVRNYVTFLEGIEKSPGEGMLNLPDASNLLNDGADLSAIKDILGHTDIRTTLIYAHGDLNSQRIAFGKQGKGRVIELVTAKG